MSEIAVTSRRPVGMRVQPAELWSRQSVLNDRLSWVLLAVVGLAPLPFGSTPQFFMSAWAVLLGLAGLIYTAALGRNNEKFRYGIQHLRLETTLFLVLCAYIVLQALPLGRLVPALAPLYQLNLPGMGSLLLETISLTPGDTWHNLLRYGTYGLLFFLMLQVATNNHRREVTLRVLLAIVTAYAVYGMAALYQFGDTILGLPKTAYLGSATGPFVNRNSFGTFLAFGVVLALSMTVGHFVQRAAEDADPRGRRSFDPLVLIYALCLAILIAALLLTQSRMAAFAALCGSTLVIVLNVGRSRNPWLAMLILGPLGLLAAGGAVYLYGQGLVERLGGVEGSLQVRLALYQQIVGMILARPWEGYGAGSFAQAYQLFHQPPVNTNLVWDKAHDTYLGLWAELGVVFGSIPIVIVALCTGRILFGLHKVRSDWTAKVAAVGIVVVGAIHSLADFSLEIPAVAMFFTAMLALGTSGIARRMNERSGAP